MGVDKSHSILEIARNRTASTYPIEYHQMSVPEDTISDVASLGGPFDIAVVNWLFNYADTKRELYEMALWVNQLLKPGGILIGWTVSIEDVRDSDNGEAKNDPKFRWQTRFDGERKEGRVWNGENEMEYVNNLWVFNTYYTVFEVAGYEETRFLEHHEYVGANQYINCTQEERAIFEEFITWKGTVEKAFMSTKSSDTESA